MEFPQAAVSIFVFTICILLGIPMWWNTTKVYRAHLPHNEIISAQNKPVKIKINVEVLFSNETPTDQVEKLKGILDKNNQVLFQMSHVEFNFNLTEMLMEKDISLKQYCKKLESVDIEERSHPLKYKFHILKNESTSHYLPYYCDKTLDTIILTSVVNGSDIGEHIIDLMKLYVNIKELPSYFQSREVLKQAKSSPSMPPSVNYRVVFTLAVANPSDYMPTWSIQEAIEDYFNPVLLKVEFLGSFKVSSQVQYFVDFKEKPNRSGKKFFYSKAKLPLLMNEIQPRLNTYTSTDATLNFIVYIPPAEYVPLFIKLKRSDPTIFNSFHSAQWGGLQFFNPSNESHHSKNIEIPVDRLIQNFVFQFQELIGLSTSEYVDTFSANDAKQISEWSLIRLLIHKNLENLSKCLNTLTSLSKLLDEIENIVISEQIKNLIDTSLENYKLSVNYLQSGLMRDSVKHSRIAFETSEKAFYDASLLALLYFPDDQKYAIYVPLFLPIAVPICASIKRTLSWYFKK